MINRQIFMVGGKKRRKGGSARKKTRLPSFCWSAGRIQPLPSRTCLPQTTFLMSK
ncbi:hypothetical protein [Aneurinibacillus migulanus]|uniref:hypothetical protein n=1 Tax=Aneurinibacillus migulanus TaxID=47500 RepID=UPI001F346395|nr:hypothetical protein [Aneurinibacillus migulanus]